MKIKQLIFPLLTLAVLLSACQKEDFSDMSAPKILFMVDQLRVDLNAAALPQIVSVVHSEAGLAKVSEYILKLGGAEELFQEPATTFVNPNSFSLNQSPLYTEDMIGYRIVALDRGGRETVAELKLSVIPLRDAPVVKLFVDELETTEFTWEEGKPMPRIRLTASSQEELRGLVFSKVISRVETIIPFAGVDTLRFANPQSTYSFEVMDVGYDEIDIETTALKLYVEAGDVNRLKRKIATLKVNVIKKPAPIITFDAGLPTRVDEFADITIGGHVTAVSHLSSVSFYRKKTTGNELIETRTFDPALPSHSFAYTLSAVDMQDEGFEVVATDKLNKTQTTAFLFAVNEMAPPPTIQLEQSADFFNGIDAGHQSLTGTITSGSGLVSISIVTKDYQGELLTSIPIEITSSKNQSLNHSIPFVNATRSIEIQAVDIHGKTTSLTMDVYVGYYYKRVLMSADGAENKTQNTDVLKPFFSAERMDAMTYVQGKAEPASPDFCFATYSSNTAIRVGNMQYGAATIKFQGFSVNGVSNFGIESWTPPLSNNPSGQSSIAIADFDKTNLDEMKAEAPPVSAGSGTFQTFASGSGNFGGIKPQMVVKFIANVKGVEKRGILLYDGYETIKTPGSHSTFYLKVKVEK